MVVDESTTIKNRKSQRTKAIVACGRAAKYRRVLTGSPITKSPLDLFSQCDFLADKALGYDNFFAFLACSRVHPNVCTPSDAGSDRRPD